MANKKQAQKPSKKARKNRSGAKAKMVATSPAVERQQERQNQTGRGSGEGTSGLQRGDGHPTGR